MKRLMLSAMLVTSGLLVTACERGREGVVEEREEVFEEQEGIGGAGLGEERGEEGLLEAEPLEEQPGMQQPRGLEQENEQLREGMEGEELQREGILEND